MPAARAGGAAAVLGGRVFYAGGLSSADASTPDVYELGKDRTVATGPPLPSAIHDAAAAALGDRVLVFGGGVSEGSNRILQVQPGPPRLLGTLPQALSDLVAGEISGVAYVAGGWNGTTTNDQIYAVQRSGRARSAARLPVGVRYPAAGVLGGRLIVAGGELTSGAPTDAAWSFNPASGVVARIPRLPVPTDHAASVVLGGRFYLIGGLRRGVLTSAIISWASGERRWRGAGHLRRALADAAAVPFGAGAAVLGGREAGGRVSTITLLHLS